MRKEFDAVRDLLLRGTRQVKLTELWQSVQDRLEIGQITNKGTLAFTEDEKSQLRQWIKDMTGVDPLEREHLPGPKTEDPGEPYQKATPREVFGRMLRLARDGGGSIPLLTGEAIVPKGSMLSVEPEYLRLEEEQIVVIDNGQLVRDWYKINLPKALKGSLIVFRGQQRDALTLLNVLDESRPKLNVGFYDFDPEGLKLAMLAEHDAILVPARWVEMSETDSFYHEFNQPERFITQIDALLFLQNNVAEGLKPMLQHMKAHKMALMQEHLVTENEPLLLVPMKH